MNPSTWSSGTVVQPSRAITKEGPAVLRLAFYQPPAAPAASTPSWPPTTATMVDRGHGHTKANVAVARKLIERTWTVLNRGEPYQLQDVDGTPVTRAQAKQLARTSYAVPPEVRPEPEREARPRTAPSSPDNQTTRPHETSQTHPPRRSPPPERHRLQPLTSR